MCRFVNHRSLAFLFLAALLFLFISCFEQPVSPYQISNTKIYLVGKDSKGNSSESLVDDSIGNTLSVGFYGNFPGNLDSVQLKLGSLDTKDSLIKVFKNLTSLNSSEMVWDTLNFAESGSFIITGTAYIHNYATTYLDSITLNIHGKPLNHPPVIAVNGKTTFSPGETCILTFSITDIDKLQKDSLIMDKAPSGASLNAGIFTWTPSASFIGIDSAVFIAQDNGYPVMSDTVHVLLTVTATPPPINHAPVWQNKTINEVGSPGNAITVTLSDKCTDPDGDPLTFTLLSGSPSTDSIANATSAPAYTFMPGPGDTGTFSPRVVATDSKGASDTLTIAITISAEVVKSNSVMYDGNGSTGGTVPSDPSTYTSGSTVTIKTNSGSLVKTGSTFAGWNTSADGTGTGYAASATFTMGSANVTLYATWTANPTYTVTYNGNGNTSGTVPTDPEAYVTGATVTTKTNSGTLAKTGSTFAGWNTAADGTGTGYAASATFTMGSANITLYATWTANPTYTVTYNGNGNTSGTVPTDPGAYVSGATVTTKTNSGTLAKTGSTFAGWNTSADGTGTGYAASATFTMGSANVMLYAKWTIIPTYTVTYNGNGNIGGTAPTDAGTYATGATVTVANPGTLVKTGYTFAGWNTSADGTGTSYNASVTFAMGSGNVNLFAKWSLIPTYTVTYNGNGNTGGVAPTDAGTYTTGTTVTVVSLGTLAKTGYSFSGWNTLANGNGTSYAAAATFAMGSANVILYAQWILIPTYTVAYNGNGNTGGTVPTDAGTYTTGATVTVASPGGLAKTGYTFAGWNTLANGNGTSYAASATFGMGSANIILYAKWTLIPTYTVTYNGNGNTGGAAPTDAGTYTTGSTVMVAGPGTLAKTGYAFAGWNTLANGNGISYNASATFAMGTTGVTLYAIWTINTYKLTITTGTGGTITTPNSSPVTVNYGAATSIVAAASNSGYAFVNWTVTTGTAAITNATSLSTTVTLSSGNATVMANFNQVQYTVTFSSSGAFQAANPATITVNAGSSVGTLPTPPIKNNYDFSYWQTSSNTAFAANTPVTQNMTVTAVWKPILDNDGNQYNTVTIGKLTWLATNLKTTTLPNQILSQGYSGNTLPAYDWYYSDPANGAIYGALYNWAAATNPNIAPSGWHVATLDDWNKLINSFPDTATAMNAIKESGTTHWLSPNPANNSSAFSALPGGFIVSGMSHDLQLDGNWWTTTPFDNGSNGYSIYIGNSMSVSSSSTTAMFLSLRCVRNY